MYQKPEKVSNTILLGNLLWQKNLKTFFGADVIQILQSALIVV